MKEIIITTQEQLDALKEVAKDEALYIKSALRLNGKLSVYGKLRVEVSLDCSFSQMRYIVGRENCSIEGWGNCSIEGWGNCSIEGWGNCSIVGRGNCSIVGRENCSIEGWENCSIVGWGNCSIEGWGNCSIEGWGNCSIVGRENCSIVGRGNTVIRLFAYAECKVSLFGFSVCFKPSDLKLTVKRTKYTHVINTKDLGWFERNGVEKKKEVVVYKRVSVDFKTQENTSRETLWTIGSTVTHPAWSPKDEECGEGKFHACSRPFFCDEFRSNSRDRYIAIRVKTVDLYEWKKNTEYPHKIAFREGVVFYECDRFGREKK